MVFNPTLMKRDDLEGLLILPQHPDEFTGFIFYESALVNGSPADLAFGVAVTGQGSPGNVMSHPNALQMVVDAATNNPNLGVIEFHTHSFETVRRHGQVFATQLSAADHQAMVAHSAYFIGYSHLHLP